jgi:deoxyribodipyrimidine photo-lyase
VGGARAGAAGPPGGGEPACSRQEAGTLGAAYRDPVPPAVLWFRRDLRLSDHPALAAAAHGGAPVLALFVLDDALRRPAGPPRLAFLYRCLRALSAATGGALVVRAGPPEQVVPAVAAEVGAASVHVSADFGPYGRRRDERVAAALGNRPLVRTGSPYAVSPGRVRRADGAPYRVYTPFLRAWLAHGRRAPADSGRDLRWLTGVRSDAVPPDPDLDGVALPEAGEDAARRRFAGFRSNRLAGYAEHRDRPGAAGTSELSADLKYGTIHPRTLLAGLDEGPGAAVFTRELVWREFHADVLHHHPDSPREPLQPAMAKLPVDTGPAADGHFLAWQDGRTGYPIVDAGMRQLLAEAWMHNRVRMVTASFLVKDLHLPWQRGARHFLRRLRDGDLASNSHGWQWVAGTGTDPAPFFRIFNPVRQGREFDPAGDYVRRYVPELRDVPGSAVHEPWTLPGGPPNGYPAPIVDHAAERREALARYRQATDR